MSLPLTDDLGVVQVAVDGVPVTWNAGLGYDAAGLLCVTTTVSASDSYSGARRVSAQGLLVVGDATAGSRPWNYNAGWPFDKTNGAAIRQMDQVPASTDPRVAGIAIGPRGGIYMTNAGISNALYNVINTNSITPLPGQLFIPPSGLTLRMHSVDANGVNHLAFIMSLDAGDILDIGPASCILNAAPIRNGDTFAIQVTTLPVLADGQYPVTATLAPPVPTWTPDSLYTGGKKGLWSPYPADFTTMFQDSTGATPVTAVEQPVGLALDKHAGLVLGPELVTNGGPFTTTTGWTPANSTLSVDADRLKITATAPYGIAKYAITTVIGKTYKIVVGFERGTAATIYASPRAGIDIASSAQSGTLTFYFTPTLTSSEITVGIQSGTSGNTAFFSLVSYKEIPGNHLSQPTAAARPVVKNDSGVYNLKHDGVDDGLGTATFAAGTLTATMDCLIAVRRDSDADVVLGFFETAGAPHNWFGSCVNGGTGAANRPEGVGSNTTTFVDGVQLPGGNSTTSGAVHTAMTVGQWHIFEVRGLDLSAWTAARWGDYGGGFSANAGNGGALLFEATTDAERNKARTWLGAQVGLTL